ncbi:uncharacterized protein [Venturia canescens]|uniref:uncharacterized protein n=1 Tax=Venturia canescens TaxID=32260 RepID=UPI001C9D5595|nr:uncharacterized protein LOC122410763 [Venturia canescens]
MKKKCSCDDYEKPQNLEANLSSENEAKVTSEDKTNEEIRKIVEGLRGVQIGDTKLVKPVKRVPSLERQIKRAVVEMQNVTRQTTEPNVVAQGDSSDTRSLCETIVNSAIEAIPERDQLLGANTAKLDACWDKRRSEIRLFRQAVNQRVEPEMSKLRSTCFLHRMIKELEDAEANRVNVLAGPAVIDAATALNAAPISAMSQERIAAWEESEERFIRTIEGSREEDDETSIDTELPSTIGTPFEIYPIEVAPMKPGVVVDVQIEELESETTSRPATPTLLSSSDPPEEQLLKATESMPLAAPTLSGTLERAKSKNKKSLGGRLRKFFSSAFKRSKD